MTDINTLTLEEKIGQMIGLAFGGRDYSNELKLQVEKIQAGLIIYFKDNVGSLEQVFNLNQEICRHAKIPPFIALDQEGGMVARVTEGITQSPGAMAIGATGKSSNAYQMAKAMGKELRKLGFTFNFAPVGDVNNNPSNPVINVRSYSENPDTVAEYVNEAIRGYSEAMMMTSIKHFPGHGDTSVDSHIGLPKIDYDEKRLMEVELKPFIRAITQDAPGIMASHVQFTYYDQLLPTSISEKIITGLLREKLGFNGLVVTDSLTMDAVFKNFSLEEIVLYGFNSGCDMLLLCGARDIAMQEKFYNIALQYAKEGRIKPERINASVERILRFKEKFQAGLMAESFEAIKPSLSVKEHMMLSKRISEESITVVRNEKKLIPLNTGDRVLVVFPKIKVVTLVENSEGILMNLTDSLKKYHQADVWFMPVDPDAKETDDLLAKIKERRTDSLTLDFLCHKKCADKFTVYNRNESAHLFISFHNKCF
jgi:beta-N-acetylhexosaminidase